MTLEEIFYASQSVASIAVVGSLIYLGLQVRGADRSQRAIMQQGRADRASNASLTVAGTELARVWEKGMAADPTPHPVGIDDLPAVVRFRESRDSDTAGLLS